MAAPLSCLQTVLVGLSLSHLDPASKKSKSSRLLDRASAESLAGSLFFKKLFIITVDKWKNMTQCTEKASANYKQVLKKLQLSLSKQGSHCKLQKRCSNTPYKQAGKTTKSFSQQCCADEQGTSGCSQSSNQLAQHDSQSCDALCEADPLLWVSCEQQDAMTPLGLEKPRVSCAQTFSPVQTNVCCPKSPLKGAAVTGSVSGTVISAKPCPTWSWA